MRKVLGITTHEGNGNSLLMREVLASEPQTDRQTDRQTDTHTTHEGNVGVARQAADAGRARGRRPAAQTRRRGAERLSAGSQQNAIFFLPEVNKTPLAFPLNFPFKTTKSNADTSVSCQSEDLYCQNMNRRICWQTEKFRVRATLPRKSRPGSVEVVSTR